VNLYYCLALCDCDVGKLANLAVQNNASTEVFCCTLGRMKQVSASVYQTTVQTAVNAHLLSAAQPHIHRYRLTDSSSPSSRKPRPLNALTLHNNKKQCIILFQQKPRQTNKDSMQVSVIIDFLENFDIAQSQWLRSLRRGSAAALKLVFGVRIPPE
jgi:hypothetical protein